MDYKFNIGDKLYAKSNNNWHERTPGFNGGTWRFINKFDEFLVINTYRQRYTPKAVMVSTKENYELLFDMIDIPDEFFTEQEYRKLKLQQLDENI